MIKGKKILGIIPARSGSKGLPGKNIKLFHNKPLIVWTIEQALDSVYLDEVIVSTDGNDIAEIAQNAGALVPFLRPKELARDDSPTADAVNHVIHQLKEMGENFDYVVLLEPTSPLRKKGDIDNAINMLIDNPNAQSLVSLGKIHMEHPLIVKRVIDGYVVPYILNSEPIHQRQQTDDVFFPYGVIYISKIDSFQKTNTFYTTTTIPYFIERWQNYEIDDETDFVIIERLFQLYEEIING